MCKDFGKLHYADIASEQFGANGSGKTIFFHGKKISFCELVETGWLNLNLTLTSPVSFVSSHSFRVE
ncbi:hypothetical protein MTR_5g087260 [Medicago truncatula]|uniref:Uncharacterized protein n=1 Tax=Medicago truncatula TaxID=3880 RepID=G7KHE7_MEDTR|nr:hypothetical protein MTR_5g087260 [Medicago truncatula]